MLHAGAGWVTKLQNSQSNAVREADSLERLEGPALWVAAVVLVLSIAFYLLDFKAKWDSTGLTLLLNIAFVVAPSFFIALIAWRGFLSTGMWPVLWLGTGTLVFGLGVLLSNWIRIWSSVNASAADYTILSLIAGAFYCAGTFFVANAIPQQEPGPNRLRILLQVVVPALALVSIVTLGAWVTTISELRGVIIKHCQNNGDSPHSLVQQVGYHRA